MRDIKISVHCEMHICASKLIVSDLETHKEMYVAVIFSPCFFVDSPPREKMNLINVLN